MITLTLDYREVLWWLRGGMSGSHVCWDVYRDMVNRVWPQCTEQERRNIHYLIRRDLGDYWRPECWSGYTPPFTGDGEWKPEEEIFDKTPWMYFRHVLARFDPDNQYAVTVKYRTVLARDNELCRLPIASVIRCREKGFRSALTVRAYKWQDEYRIDWHRRCDETAIVKIEKMTIPDNGTM